jgi:integrase
MIPLPNGCSRSEFITYPSNWKSSSASISVNWYIKYRFYEPGQPPVQKVVKGNMNRLKTVKDRQGAMRALLADEDRLLTKERYHPGKNQMINGEAECGEMSTIEALKYAAKKISVSDRTKKDIKYLMDALPEIHTPVKDFSRRDIKRLLEGISTSNDRYNKNRTNLMILYSELVEDEIIETNHLRDIKKKKVVKILRSVLMPDERKLVKEQLLQYPGFYRFVEIFFHSGARISELLRLRYEDVDLKNQYFKVVIYKGRQYRQVRKVIKNIALPYWITQFANCKPGEYLFSTSLNPGPKQVSADYVTNRWRRCVQVPLKIKPSFYSLKHLHSDEISAGVGLSVAGKHNDHKGTVITMTYAVKEKQRMEEIIKTADNSF